MTVVAKTEDLVVRESPVRSATPLPINHGVRGLRSPANFGGAAWMVRVLDTLVLVAVFQVCLSLRTGVWDYAAVMDFRLLGIWSALVSCLYLSDCYRFDGHLPGWNLPVRTVVVTLIAGLLVGLGVYLLGPAAMTNGYTELSLSLIHI
jgi:hypothetical protein